MPIPVLCAIGFAAAGSGVGSLVVTALHPWFFPDPPSAFSDHDQKVMAMYGGTFRGIVIGIAVGAVAGVLYAVAVRRARREGHNAR